jgi:hypothetical integral membrane protein (TIGR02206 family)
LRVDSRFVAFGVGHLMAIGLPIAVGAALARQIRARPDGRTAVCVRIGLAGSIVLLIGWVLLAAARGGWLSLELLVPLHLCDLALLLAVYALLARSQPVAEVLWFWAGAGTMLAMVTPDVAQGFPDPQFLLFFGLHGLVVMATIVLVFGMSLRPREGAPRRVFLITVAYAAVVGMVDAVLGTNFLFLCHKPANPTLLDAFGPWPVYIVVAALLAFLLFQLLGLPFRRARTA